MAEMAGGAEAAAYRVKKKEKDNEINKIQDDGKFGTAECGSTARGVLGLEYSGA